MEGMMQIVEKADEISLENQNLQDLMTEKETLIKSLNTELTS